MKKVFVIKATTGAETVRYKTLYNDYEQVQKAVNNLIEGYKNIVKLCEQYGVTPPIETKYEIIQTR